MAIPPQRSKRRLPRGTFSNLSAGIADFVEGELCYARDQNSLYVVESGELVNPTDIRTVNLTTVNYTLGLTDICKIIEVNSASARVVTVPSDTTSDFYIGFNIDIIRIGTGSVTISPDAGVTILSANSSTSISTRYGSVTLRKRAANSWILTGDLA